MEADCCSCSCPQNFSQGHEFSVAIKREPVTTFFWKKVSSMSRSIIWNGSAKTVLLLSVGSNVHQHAKIPYLSNKRFRSSTTFIGKDCCFGVSINKLDSRWKQTVFFWELSAERCTWTWGSGSYRNRVFNNFVWKSLVSLLHSISLRADGIRLLYC